MNHYQVELSTDDIKELLELITHRYAILQQILKEVTNHDMVYDLEMELRHLSYLRIFFNRNLKG